MRRCCAAPSTGSRDASESVSSRLRSWRTPRSATSRSSASCCSRTSNTPAPASASTAPSRLEPHTADPFYRRALAAIALNDWQAAVADLDRVAGIDARYDYHRAAGLRAHALAQVGREEEALALFAEATATSTLSETQYNYASLLAAKGRTAEAREWAQRILAKKLTLPAFARRRERPWFRKASALVQKLPKG